MNIAVVDYGIGNLGSIPNMLARAGAHAIVTSEPAVILEADRLILPGVGAFDAGMRSLMDRGLVEALRRRTQEHGVMTLGLCLGMQLLFESSEEGALKGLGWIPGSVKRFRFPSDDIAHRVPHMGWNNVAAQSDRALLDGLGPEPRFYFAHSYYASPENPADVVATTEYGNEFASIVRRDNIIGAQFHPEKSHRFGLGFLSNFISL